MGRVYNVIDSDGHILEPLNLWENYIDPGFRDRAPRLFIDEDGKERLRIDGRTFGGRRGLGTLGAIGARDGVVCDDTMTYKEGKKGGFDPHARIPDMDADGIDAAFLYPSIGLSFGGVEDPRLVHALYHAYNRWLADYCKPYPDRLFGVAMLPLHSVELTIQEMRFARNELGMRAAFIRPNPYNNKMLHHPDYEPFWNAAEELDMAIGSTKARASTCRPSGSTALTGAALSTSSRIRWR
jgi:predicted TIM-barrel fold metal-dependent hydrolase